MKILVFSDIHGRASSLDKILELYNKDNFDKVILLGDVLYHGPRNDIPEDYNVKYVFNGLNTIKDDILWIKGNCDSEVDEMVLEFKVHNDAYIELNNSKVYLVHGHHLNFNSSDNFTANNVLYGHYHIPSVNDYDNRRYINVGSISLPKGGSSRSYAIINDNHISIYDIDDKLILESDFIK